MWGIYQVPGHGQKTHRLVVAAIGLTVALTGATAATAGSTEPPHSDPLPSCVDTAKVRKSTGDDPFNVRYTVRCDFTVNRVNLTTTKKVARVKAVPTVDPAAVAPFTCSRPKPRRLSCHGDSGPPNTRIMISLRVVKPGPCEKPKLTFSGTTRGVPYCPSGPCTANVTGARLSAAVSGC